MCLLQETLLTDPGRINFSGYTAHHLLAGDRGATRGCTILVSDTIPHRVVDNPVQCGEDVEVQAIKLFLAETELLVYNLYRRSQADPDLSELFSLAEEETVLIGGDFNAHHELFCSKSRTNNAGRHIATLLEELPGVKLLNPGTPTHLLGNPLDLTFASAALAERADWTLHPTLTSDHFAVVITTDVLTPQTPTHPPRWCFKKANWVTFRREMAAWWRDYTQTDDIDKFEQDFTDALVSSANRAIPVTTGSRPPSRNWWFHSPRMKEVNHRVNRLRKIFRRTRSQANLELLKEAVAHARQVAQEEKEAKWLEWCEGFSNFTSLKELWSCLQRVTGGGKKRTPAHPNPAEEAESLVLSYTQRAATTQLPIDAQRRQEQLLPERTARIRTAIERPDSSDRPFTLQELQRAKKMSKDTAPGENNITYSMLRSMGPAGESAMLALVNASWSAGRLPETWKTAVIHPIPKPKEPNKTRPISLLSCIAKTAERMVLSRLKWKLGAPHHNIYGFAESRSAADSIASLLAEVNNKPAIIVFLDLEKAFELASPTAIADRLAERGVCGRLLSWTHDYLSNRRAKVKFQGHTSSLQRFENGTPQGGVLSPTLFNVLMEELVRLPLHRQVSLLSYADDLALVSTGPGDRMARAQRGLDAIAAACRELGLKISAQKSQAMATMCRTPDTSLRIQGVCLQWVPAYQYLGVWVDQRLTFRKEVEYLKERTKARISVMRAMTTTKAGATDRVLRLYYVQAVRSLVDYAAVTLVSLADTNRRSLEAIQNSAMRHILGAPRWTNAQALQAEADLPPLALRVEQLAATLSAKIINSPVNNPARQRFLAALPQDDTLFTEKTWLRSMMRAVHATLGDIDLVGRGDDGPTEGYIEPPPWADPPAKIHFTQLPQKKSACSREMLLTRTTTTLLQAGNTGARTYYTDGSVDPNTGKTAAALVCGEERLGWRLTDHCSTLQTELVGIASALLHTRQHNSKHTTVFTDSLTALRALLRYPAKDNVRLITMTRLLLSRLKDEGKEVTLAWIPSHIGIDGNEAADGEAKRALSQDRPTINVPLSLQQIKRTAKTATTRRTEEMRRDAEAQSATLTWQALATGGELLTLPSTVTRRDRVSMHRLRLGFPTVRSLREGYDGEICNHCGDSTDQPLVHYLLDCEETGPLRTLAARHGYTDSSDRLSSAARLVRYAAEDYEKLLECTRKYDPPR